MQLDEKVAFITGAGSGIGKGAALLLAKEGARVACLDLQQEDADTTVREIEAAGGQALAVSADVSQADQVEQAIKKTVDRFGRLDIVFANAGINGVWAPIEELEPEEWDKTLNTNLRGTFLTIKYAVPYLKKQGAGAVVVTASVNGTRIFSNTGATAYSTTKAGQVAMTKMLALELAPSHIRVNVICPGAIETKIEESTQKRDVEKVKIPVEFPKGSEPLTGKPGTIDETAQLVLFLVSDSSKHITGTEVWIDGGASLLRG